MNLLELSKLLLDEKLAEEYLLEKGILKTFTNCAKCGSTKLGRIRRQRYKCYGCKSEWGIRKGSILHAQTISSSKFIGLIKCFELETSGKEAAKQLVLGIKTVEKIYNIIRLYLSDKNEITNEHIDSIIAKEENSFSISIINGIVNITVELKNNSVGMFTVKRSRVPKQEASYTFKYKNIKPNYIGKKLNTFPIEYNHFWRYVKVKLLDYRGTKVKYLYFYLKEIEFRYNNRKGNNLFEKIVAKIAQF